LCACVLQALRAIADKLEGPQGAGMLTAAVHASAIEFLMNRLPPHPKQLGGKGRAPTLDDKLCCRVAGWGYLLPFEMTGMVCEDDDSNGEQTGERSIPQCIAYHICAYRWPLRRKHIPHRGHSVSCKAADVRHWLVQTRTQLWCVMTSSHCDCCCADPWWANMCWLLCSQP
jgi:hypothetical protein